MKTIFNDYTKNYSVNLWVSWVIKSNVPMIFHNKGGFFKDMNAICKVLNAGQPVLQIMTVLSFVSRVLLLLQTLL